MNAKLYFNKSDKRYINKDIEQVYPHSEGTPPEWIKVEFIEPTSIENPRLILSTETNVLQANYLFLEDFGRYYYINNHTLEKGRVIIDCKVDVLMSFATEIMQENVILDRISTQKNLQNYYLEDDEIKKLSYPYIEMHDLDCVYGNAFDQDQVYFILAVSGAVVGSTNNEEGVE